ncbi:MAG: ATP-binding protein, partial [Betaproteobacteria bacterium]|nr:ATP-binding protein [Betaproteobacteria bacterium]
GALAVDLTIPTTKLGTLVVEDDGHGMTPSQFRARWMKLGYNRAKHQGSNVEFPPERKELQRRAYGRNGVGRHGLLCFSDRYEVETSSGGKRSNFVVSTYSKETPFILESERITEGAGHGTRLSVSVERHLPDADRIREILSARFLHDPKFIVRVNGQSIALLEHTGLIEQSELKVTESLSVQCYVIDSTKAASTTLYQGIAFWVNNRLVGTPSWVVGSTQVLDGRGRFAKRYSIVVSCGPEWIPELEADWTRFRSGDPVRSLQGVVCSYAQLTIKKLSQDMVDESSEDALVRNREQFRELPNLARIEVANFTQELVQLQPSISPETLAIAVQAVINLEKSRSGTALLDKLTKLDESDIDGLDRLLSQWTVRDALSVLDEIDHRLSVITAIEKLCGEKNTDELHTLHPLVTQARWLFGPEFDSHEYSSNVTLRSATEKVFGQKPGAEVFKNSRQRPDLVALADATYSIVGTETFDSHDQNLTAIRDVLIIELKKGRSMIGRAEVNQANGYVQDFLGCEVIDGTPFFRAFVVGYEIESKTQREIEIKDNHVLRARVVATTYGQLTRTAHQRFFKLKEKIPARFDDLTGSELVSRVMQTMSQKSILPGASGS